MPLIGFTNICIGKNCLAHNFYSTNICNFWCIISNSTFGALRSVLSLFYSRHAQHTARGPNVARKGFKSDPRNTKSCLVGLFLSQKPDLICKNTSVLALQKIFFDPPRELSCAPLFYRVLWMILLAEELVQSESKSVDEIEEHF